MARESLLGSPNIQFVLEQLYLTYYSRSTAKELRDIVHSYISDIKSTRGFASTWTWRPFYGSLTLLHVV